MTGRRPTIAGWRLGTRLFVAQAIALVASVLTAGLLAAVIGPPVFHAHLIESGHPQGTTEMPHIEAAFASAGITSLAVGLLVALVLALAVTWYVTRRIRRPLDSLSRAALQISTGEYAARVHVTGAGPELATVAESFNDMASRLGGVEQTRRRLLADLAHELRTPVATLNAQLEALSDGVIEWGEPTMNILQYQADRLTRLARDLDDVSRAEEGQITLDAAPYPLHELVTVALDQMRDRFAAKGVRLTQDVAEQDALVDPQRLAQVLGNLLNNALRHTPTGGQVTVSAGAPQDRVTRLVVTDTGEGLTPDQLDHIFERFYRGDNARNVDEAGSGIGLTIARALVEAHGGRLRASSAGPGHGASFTLTLPIP